MSPTGLRRLLLTGALAAAAGLGACVPYPGDYGYGGYAYDDDYGYGYRTSRRSYADSYPSRYDYPRYYSSRRYDDDDRRRYRRIYSDRRRDDDRRRYDRRDDDDRRRYVRRDDDDHRRHDGDSRRARSRQPLFVMPRRESSR